MGCGTSQLWQCLEEVHLLRSAGQISMCQIQQLAECTWLNEYRNVQQNSIEKLDLLEILKSKGLWVSFMFSCTADETLTKKSPYRRKGRTAIYNYYWLQRNISKLCNKDTLCGNWREIFSQATPAVLIVHSTSLSACVAMFISKGTGLEGHDTTCLCLIIDPGCTSRTNKCFELQHCIYDSNMALTQPWAVNKWCKEYPSLFNCFLGWIWCLP